MAKRKSRWMQKAAARMKKKGTVGAFTRWCKSRGYKSVTGACIAEGLRSKNPKTRQRANFARNARKARRREHQVGGEFSGYADVKASFVVSC